MYVLLYLHQHNTIDAGYNVARVPTLTSCCFFCSLPNTLAVYNVELMQLLANRTLFLLFFNVFNENIYTIKFYINLSISAKSRYGCKEWPRWCEGVGGILRATVTKPFPLASCYILWNLVAR